MKAISCMFALCILFYFYFLEKSYVTCDVSRFYPGDYYMDNLHGGGGAFDYEDYGKGEWEEDDSGEEEEEEDQEQQKQESGDFKKAQELKADLTEDDYITIKNLHDLKREWFENSKSNGQMNPLIGTENKVIGNDEKITNINNLFYDKRKKETDNLETNVAPDEKDIDKFINKNLFQGYNYDITHAEKEKEKGKENDAEKLKFEDKEVEEEENDAEKLKFEIKEEEEEEEENDAEKLKFEEKEEVGNEAENLKLEGKKEEVNDAEKLKFEEETNPLGDLIGENNWVERQYNKNDDETTLNNKLSDCRTFDSSMNETEKENCDEKTEDGMEVFPFLVKSSNDRNNGFDRFLRKMKDINDKIYNSTVSCFNVIKSKLKAGFEKNKEMFNNFTCKWTGKMCVQKPKYTYLFLGEMESYLIEINKRYAEKQSFELSDYISQLHYLGIYIFRFLKENVHRMKAKIDEINQRVELRVLEEAAKDMQMRKQLCTLPNEVISKYKMDLINRNYFTVKLDLENKRFFPKLERIPENRVVKYLKSLLLLCDTQCKFLSCPPNSKCYNINGDEECRCIPGFSNAQLNDRLECVKDEFLTCDINNGGCDENAKCFVQIDKIVCECNEGFLGDGIYCSFAVISKL